MSYALKIFLKMIHARMCKKFEESMGKTKTKYMVVCRNKLFRSTVKNTYLNLTIYFNEESGQNIS